MADFSIVKLPNTDTEGEYLGIEMDFLEIRGAQERESPKLEEIAPEAKRERAS